ncbi:hypothetical protein VTI74DRAFT_4247 [Chaetomium olivicolor]
MSSCPLDLNRYGHHAISFGRQLVEESLRIPPEGRELDDCHLDRGWPNCMRAALPRLLLPLERLEVQQKCQWLSAALALSKEVMDLERPVSGISTFLDLSLALAAPNAAPWNSVFSFSLVHFFEGRNTGKLKVASRQRCRHLWHYGESRGGHKSPYSALMPIRSLAQDI